ncbi:ISAzo13 family transposase [Ktedonobacter racemifer]|uniref:Rhodopirellula transposase family protein n=1 Tax=Ktedonobacter racemifer DSM 44963 TaxID=485913 RepID=D6U0I1_KTERA|nr:ISAzo13 family transposase [Ktedonobacter racemifer]EFH82321.1 Rhodopirellula transposase family protein [Ktedonobacter racemifer DSM 44963]
MRAGMMQVSRREKYEHMREMLNEKQWRHYLALEAQERGSVAQVAQEARVSQNTIRRGLREVEAGERYNTGDRQREEGGGRKQAVEKDASLLTDLESLLEPKGDPMSLLKWTTKSVAHLKEALERMGHEVAETTIRRILRARGYSLRAKKKNIEGTSHPDRDEQFEHIRTTCQEFEQHGNPIISVDCKKKELLGQFKNNGAEWQAKGEATEVNVYDFLSLANGKAIPYGIYDLVHNHGFVNVGIDHDTAEFAVESIRRWWQQRGKALYPGKKALLITADGGGSNGVRNRLWKKKLQELADEEQLAITVAHYPPATSKWKKIEHRLFSFISINWRATPLTSLEVVLELISHTTTTEGLTVTAQKDSQTYPTGTKVTDKELAALRLLRDTFHGEWNYTILPHALPSSDQLI